jgi:GNAT superfamily N-acetyltransferase
LSYVAALPSEETLIGSWTALTQVSRRARMINFPAAIAAVFPSWAPLNNAILLAAPGGPAATTAASQLSTLYADAGVAGWALWVRSSIADLDAPDVGPEPNGLKRDTTTLVMETRLQPGLRLHDEAVSTSIATATRAAGEEPVRRADLEPPDGVPGLSGWVLLQDDLAVAGAWSFLHGDDCGIYAVGTLPQWRRRGFARALMEHVLADASRRGARTASLQSTRMGQPLYASLGFRAVGRYEEWISGITLLAANAENFTPAASSSANPRSTRGPQAQME